MHLHLRIFIPMKEQRIFGKTGLRVSPLGFGGAPIGYLAAEQQQVTRILNLLLDAGVNVIDTAECYPGSEPLIGQAVGHRRKEFVLVTKCGHQAEGLSGAEWSPQLITQTVDRSLTRLRTDHLDVVLLHSGAMSVLQRGDALAALAKARAAGKIRFLGYSGDNEEAAFAAGLPEVDVIETSVNICDQSNLDSVLPKARERNLGVLAKRPIANAAWKSAQRGIYTEYAQPYAQRLRAMGLTPHDLGFQGDPDSAWPEIALRFTLAQPGVHVAITGTTDPDNARKNLAIAERGPLPAAAVTRIRGAFRAACKGTSTQWPGLT
jgi:aryl-alcohol dehydrogenase-like predicted oxidoreductase